jgi:hypothetical protein
MVIGTGSVFLFNLGDSSNASFSIKMMKVKQPPGSMDIEIATSCESNIPNWLSSLTTAPPLVGMLHFCPRPNNCRVAYLQQHPVNDCGQLL